MLLAKYPIRSNTSSRTNIQVSILSIKSDIGFAKIVVVLTVNKIKINSDVFILTIQLINSKPKINRTTCENNRQKPFLIQNFPLFT